MAKFYKLQIGDFFLTDTGLESGDPVKLEIPGADRLLSTFTGSTIIALDGTPINQVFEIDKRGIPLEIRILTYISKALWQSIISLINTALENSGTINLIGIGDIGNFDVNAKPLLPRPFEAKDFKNERIKTPIFRFITT